MTDHKRRAETALSDARGAYANPVDRRLVYAQIATAEATLELAHQQRTANLIAYWHPEQPVYPGTSDEYKAEREAHREEIRKGLGLS